MEYCVLYCVLSASLRMKGVVYKACVCSALTYGAETCTMKAGVFQRLRATKRRMFRVICGVTLKDDMVESTVIALRVGVDDLGAFEAEKIEVVWTYCKKR